MGSNRKTIFVLGLIAGYSIAITHGCKDGAGAAEAAPPNLTIRYGYEPAFFAGELYVPENIDTSAPASEYEPKFCDVGRVFRQWLGQLPADEIAPRAIAETGKIRRAVKVTYVDKSKIGGHCASLGGDAQSTACTDPDDGSGWCRVYIPIDHTDCAYGHELWHCVDGYYHG